MSERNPTSGARKPSAAKARALDTFKRAIDARAPWPKIEVIEDDQGPATIAVGDPEEPDAESWRLLIAALGNLRPEIALELVRHLADVNRRDGSTDAGALSFALAVVEEAKPEDGLEAVLAVQMAAVHLAAMKALKRLHQAEGLAQFEAQERAANRLLRTFATQMQTLKKYRSKGEQKVTVEHVTVNEGGQAIVGAVGGGGGKDRGEVAS